MLKFIFDLLFYLPKLNIPPSYTVSVVHLMVKSYSLCGFNKTFPGIIRFKAFEGGVRFEGGLERGVITIIPGNGVKI